MTAKTDAGALRPGRGPLRLVRCVAAALVCVFAAALGHLTAGGSMPGMSVVAVFLGSGAVAWLLSSRRVTVGQMLGLLVLCQVAVHLSASSSDMTMSAGMVIAHLAATVASVVLLARGESFVWQLADRLGLRAVTSLVILPLPHAIAPAPVQSPRVRRDAFLAHSRVERGPPSGSS